MNKILVNTKVYNLTINENSIVEIDNLENDSIINIKTLENISSTINFLVKNSNINIIIELSNNSNLVINELGVNSSINVDVNIQDSSNLEYNLSILSKVDSINNIKILSSGNSSNCLFFTNGVNLSNNKLFFIIDGIIKKDCKDIYLEENSKIINIMNGNSKIIPNLIVDSKDIVANHSAYIGKFSDEDIWYLNSRGINTNDCKKLLLKAVLLKNMEDNNRFLDIINHFILDDRKGDNNE